MASASAETPTPAQIAEDFVTFYQAHTRWPRLADFGEGALPARGIVTAVCGSIRAAQEAAAARLLATSPVDAPLVLDALMRYRARAGAWPSPEIGEHEPDVPSRTVATRLFGSWDLAIAAARQEYGEEPAPLHDSCAERATPTPTLDPPVPVRLPPPSGTSALLDAIGQELRSLQAIIAESAARIETEQTRQQVCQAQIAALAQYLYLALATTDLTAYGIEALPPAPPPALAGEIGKQDALVYGYLRDHPGWWTSHEIAAGMGCPLRLISRHTLPLRQHGLVEARIRSRTHLEYRLARTVPEGMQHYAAQLDALSQP